MDRTTRLRVITGSIFLGALTTLYVICAYVSTVAVFAILCTVVVLYVLELRACQKLNLAGKHILITGCDSGFGYNLAKRLDLLGCYVYAGCLLKDKNGEGATSLQESCSQRLTTLQLNVNNEDEIQNAYEKVKASCSSEGLWGIVNNAGLSSFGAVELCTMDIYKRMMDVNLWGVIRVTKTFLPLVRKSKGRIVAVTSGLGRVSHAGRSAYGMTKYALEAFCDVLRYEMRQWGISVSIVMPGNFLGATRIVTTEGIQELANEMWRNASPEIQKVYGQDKLDSNVKAISDYVKCGVPNIEPVIESYVNALSDVKPKARYYATDFYWFLKVFIATHFPESVTDRIYM